MNDTAGGASAGRLAKFTGWMKQFVDAVADARIPPDSMPIVPDQGLINALTGGIGVTLYTVASYVLASGQGQTLADRFILVVVSAALLFAAALIVLAIAKDKKEVQALWQRTTSAFVVVWLLSLIAFLLLTYPLLFLVEINLLDRIAYGLNNLISDEPQPWRDDLTKAVICSFIAGLFVLYRTRMLDQNFSLKSAKPWVWLAMVTLIVSVVMDVALFQSWRNA